MYRLGATGTVGLEGRIGQLLAVSAGLATVVALLVWFVGRVVSRTIHEPGSRYNARRLARGVGWAVVAIGLAFVWRPFGGDLGPAVGLATAGLAFAMQEVIGAVAGWFNITFGRIFQVGDRVRMAGVQGDVIDVSLLKTRLMEIGSEDGATWVGGRQYTGRVVTVSNKASFTEPVYNYSSYFEFIWEEVEVAIPHHGDWRAASKLLEAEARRQSSSEGARAAMDETRRRFPVPEADVEPRVFASADEDFVRLAVRFVVPIRNARAVKDEIIRRIHSQLEDSGIEVVATNVVEHTDEPWKPVVPAPGSSPDTPRR